MGGGRSIIRPVRTAVHDLVALVARDVLEGDDARILRLFDRRVSTISVSTRIVSPWKVGFGNAISPKPRLPSVVPSVVSYTVMPATSASRNMLFTRRWPYIVFLLYSASMQRRAVVSHRREQHVVGLGHRAADRMLDHHAGLEFFEVKACHFLSPGYGLSDQRLNDCARAMISRAVFVHARCRCVRRRRCTTRGLRPQLCRARRSCLGRTRLPLRSAVGAVDDLDV